MLCENPKNLPAVSEDLENKEAYADIDEISGKNFGWYRWNFAIDPERDTAGIAGDGIGTVYFRLFVPETEEGTVYPLVLNLGGLGSSNTIHKKLNGYAYTGSAFASEVNQEKNPSYVLTCQIPFEAACNYEAETDYIYQIGEIAKWIVRHYGNVDPNRIYATGKSQGAGWSYELAALQPDLLAAILINAGTLIQTTWGDECDAEALASSDVNIYIWHGLDDIFIPVNEAYRAYHTLTRLGRKNIILDIDDCAAIGNPTGHTHPFMYSFTEITSFMQWLYDQKKGIPCTEVPQRHEEGKYADYQWAGRLVFKDMEGWAEELPYADWTEPRENRTWDRLKAAAPGMTEGPGGTGRIWLGRVRIGDETVTTYDDIPDGRSRLSIQAGDSICLTMQGYTGGYGDDWDAFMKEWSVDWAVLEGSVSEICLTHEKSAEPILRPETVTLTNGGGPNVNNSLYNENTLDGKQVYLRIDTAEHFIGSRMRAALRFTRKLKGEEYASYYHIAECDVLKK